MNIVKNIPIQNIYYMLTYAFQALSGQGYKNIEAERFENINELFAEILIKGIKSLLKQGLDKEYMEISESLSVLRGKINISESIKTNVICKNQLNCVYDEFTINSYQNKILKSTLLLLVKSNITKERKKELKKLLIFFNDVDTISLYNINWKFQYNKNNQTYKMLISICNLIIEGLLHSTADGETKLMDFLDEQKEHRLFEKFVFEYYKKEFPMLQVTAPHIKWQLDNDFNYMLPTMKSDIMLTYNNQIFIIDTKFYARSLQKNYDKYTIHSNNLYQIFTYVKNKDIELRNSDFTVVGMLLYAKTNEEVYPDCEYIMSGNKISVKTLNLNCDFKEIVQQLEIIISQNFVI